MHVLESLFGFNSKLRLSSSESFIKFHQINFLVMINYGLRMITFANTSNENPCFIDFITFIIKLDEWEILLQSLFSPSTICNQTAFCCVLTEILCEDCMELVIMISIFVLINELWIFGQLLIVNKLYIFGQAVDTNDIKACLQDTCHSWTTSQESISANDGPVVLLAVSVDITIFHDFVTFTIFFWNFPPISVLICIFLHEIITVSIRSYTSNLLAIDATLYFLSLYTIGVSLLFDCWDCLCCCCRCCRCYCCHCCCCLSHNRLLGLIYIEATSCHILFKDLHNQCIVFWAFLRFNEYDITIKNLWINIFDDLVLIAIVFLFDSLIVKANNLMNVAQMTKYLYKDWFQNERATSKLTSFNVCNIQAYIW